MPVSEGSREPVGRCRFIPSYLLERLRDAGENDALARCAAATLAHDALLREARTTLLPAVTTAAAWVIHTAANTTDLPGRPVRSAGEPVSGDAAVDEAAAGIQATLDLLASAFDRRSYDGKGAGVSATVHYGTDYDNAFWDGTQLVFGDGDGTVFGRFTKPVDVLAHELAHAVTERTAGLTYSGQSGALNESFSDVVGACVKQAVAGQSAAQGDWLIGEGIFLPGVQGVALRSMAAPGTAYDDPRLGKDPQVGSMADYVETSDDDGGVHLNSGIPNRAFQLAASAIGGSSAEGAGRIWYAALTSGIGPDTDFAGFAAATVAAAGDHADAVRAAWTTVGVAAATGAAAPARSPAPTGRTVRVVRSGGIAGLRRSGELALDAGDPVASDAARLLDRIDFQGVVEARPQPDRYVYDFHVPEHHVRVAEQDLTDDLRRLAGLVLDASLRDG